jgi:cytochrome c oxidase cbb3-type subunit 3
MGTQEQPDILRGHPEDSDGIEEYDNELPRWWVGLFIFTVIWGVWVMLDWHVLSSKTLVGKYVERAEELGIDKKPDLSAIAVSMGEDSISSGREVYVQNCAVCHEMDASGNIGPSLIDDEWLYASDMRGVLESIAVGRPNGMPAWHSVLGDEKVADVTAYVASLTGIQPEGDKEAPAEDETAPTEGEGLADEAAQEADTPAGAAAPADDATPGPDGGASAE